MLDIKLIQNDFESVAQSLRKKKVDENLLEELRAISLELKSARLVLEPLQAEQNSKSKLFGVYAKERKDVGALKAELSENKAKIADAQEIVRALEEKLEALATIIPNMPSPLVPDGEDENDNVELKRVLEPKTFSFTPKEHWDIDSAQNWIDFERGVKLAKSRFSVLKNEAARLERALINYMLDFNRMRGFVEVAVPYIVNRETLMGTGQLPKFEDDLFKIEGEDLFLIPTAEVPVTNLFRDEILTKEELPLKMTAYSACFR